MGYFYQDFLGLLLSSVVAPFLLYAPGFFLVTILERAGFEVAGLWQRFGWAMILAIAVIPAIDALLIRWCGMAPTMALHLLFAGFGLWGLRRLEWKIPPIFLATALIWWLIVLGSYADFSYHGVLNQSLIAIDLVKHSAIVDTIARDGLPLRDPFFARVQPAGYYYYFYLWPAAVQWLCGSAISSRMAFAGTTFWLGVAFPALLWILANEARFIRAGRERRMLLILIGLCFVTGADILAMLPRYLLTNTLSPQIDMWNEEVRFVLTSIIWVPHHLAAVVACWCSIVLFSRARQIDGWRQFCLGAFASVGLATTFGMSVWIMVTAVPILIICGLHDLTKRKFLIPVCGVLALLISLPQLADLVHGRTNSGFPLAFWVKPLAFLDFGKIFGLDIFSIFLLPFGYFIEFGFFSWGSNVYLRMKNNISSCSVYFRYIIAYFSISSLILSSFIRSTIIYNDFGWRSIWFAEVAAILYTAFVLQSFPLLRIRFSASILLLLGLAGNAWDLFGQRFIRPPYFRTMTKSQDMRTNNALYQRSAYEWANHHIPSGAIIQHGIQTGRATAFGLYGHNRPSIADREANLFGASRKEVYARIRVIEPIFERPLSLREVEYRSRSAKIDYLLFTSTDPIWKYHGKQPSGLPCIYRNAKVCIAKVPGIQK